MALPLDFRFAPDAIHLSGSMTFDAHHNWRQMLQQMPAPQQGERLRLDLSQVDQMDAAGLGLLLITHDTLQAQNAALSLVRPQGNVRRVLDVSGFAAMVRIEEE